MGEETTHSLPDSRSFEERVFARFDAFDARFDALDAGIRDLNGRVERLEARVESLEAESQRRAADTKPIWERALAEIGAVRQDVAALSQKVDALTERMDIVEHKLDVFWNDMLTLRGQHKRIEVRMDKLESKPAT